MTNFGDHDDYDRVGRQLALRECRARIARLVAEHRRERVGRAVDDGRLPEEAVRRCDVPSTRTMGCIQSKPPRCRRICASTFSASPTPPVELSGFGFDADRIEEFNVRTETRRDNFERPRWRNCLAPQEQMAMRAVRA
ncbi:TPA: hypothetical protein QDC51_005176 [Burkholderia multivorans]|nr:hypothetical protein [Burkholderia multivorans]MBU9393052.1 hypothetical protein [Burkholderia multivorans]HDR9838325.1 hypothetical protein [Burkholderia multivorans]HDR9843134.1 hypothetical protein [Burkholderia multivorans]HDR9850875.1 hypothetical protein [Burkholderia multivorans]